MIAVLTPNLIVRMHEACLGLFEQVRFLADVRQGSHRDELAVEQAPRFFVARVALGVVRFRFRVRPVSLKHIAIRLHACDLFQPNTPLVFAMRGAAATAVTAAVTGLEAFANHHVLRFETEAGSGVIKVEGHERAIAELQNAPVNERYKDVLPKLLDKPRPTSEPWWPTLRRVQGLAVLQRHALYEPLERKGLDGKKTLAERIYGGEYRGVASMMLAAYEYFAPGWVSPGRLDALHAAEAFTL
jgi:hypothetical protein